MFRQYIHGARTPKAGSAGIIESAMHELAGTDIDAPYPLNRGELCPDCKACPYMQHAMSEVDDLK